MLSRVKLTVTIDANVLEKAKALAEQKGVPLSRLVEKLLSFFASPYVYCFSCGAKFEVEKASVCTKCGWLLCPHCGACRCSLSDEVASAVYHMRKVYEDLLLGRLKP